MKKKVICQALRFFAHTHGATLLFVSTREKGLQNNVRVGFLASLNCHLSDSNNV
jgi:hypothetical protein